MRIATWNVNSIKARMEVVMRWLAEVQPDVLLLQEIKCETEQFPLMEIQGAGYKAAVLGQKSYNGVAILSKHPIEDVVEHLPEAGADTQSRYLEATIKGIRVASIYLPNGNPMETEKFAYKLAWLERLKQHAESLLLTETPIVLGGDYNVIPEEADVFDPKGWDRDALFHPATRASFRELISLGLTEAYRALHPTEKHAYTFWDYQAASWSRDLGLRIDHFLLSPEACDRLTGCSIDRTPRSWERASDHTPVLLDLAS